MRRYETTYILRPNLGEEQFSEIIERTNAIITDDGGSIINLERWGNKKLAYEIKKETIGHYVYFDFAAPGATIQEMERIFRIDDRVLRFLTVKLAESIDEETIASETEKASAIATEDTEEDAAEKEASTDAAPAEEKASTDAASEEKTDSKPAQEDNDTKKDEE